MTHRIRVIPTHSTTEWRVSFEDGAYICDVRISISSMLHGSRFQIVERGTFVRDGTFSFSGFWDRETIAETLTAIVHSLYPGAEVTVEVPEARAAGM